MVVAIVTLVIRYRKQNNSLIKVIRREGGIYYFLAFGKLRARLLRQQVAHAHLGLACSHRVHQQRRVHSTATSCTYITLSLPLSRRLTEILTLFQIQDKYLVLR